MAAPASLEPPAPIPAGKKLSTYDLAIGLLAILSLVVFALLVFAPLASSTKAVLNALEDFLCVVFLCDFIRSLYRAQHKWAYVLREGGWLDLLGSIPFSAFALFRVFRLFRIVRALRALRSSDLRGILTTRIAESALLFTLVMALVLIFVIGAIVVWAEHGAPNANIKTYPEAVWWAVVTITTVGYGDYFPVTTVGRLAAAVLMFCGLGIIGVLSSYLATTFISLQASRRARSAAGDANRNGPGAEALANDDDATTHRSTEMELAAIKEELAAIRKLLAEGVQMH